MTVSTLNTSNTYTADGLTGTFPFDFQALTTDQIHAYVDDVEDVNLTIIVNVDQVLNPGGTVQFLSGNPAASTVVLIQRETLLTQLTDYLLGGNFPSESHESALDKLTMIAQEYDAVDISFGDVLSDGSVPFTGDVTIDAANPTLILQQDAANQTPAIDMLDELGNSRLELRYIDVAGLASLTLKDAAETALCALALGVDGNIGVSPPSIPSLAGHLIRLDYLQAYAEPELGDPLLDGSILSSLADGTRSWLPPSVVSGDVLSDGSVPFTGDVTIDAADPTLNLQQSAANQTPAIDMLDELGNSRLELRYIDVAGLASLTLKDAAGTALCALALGVDGNIGLSPPSTPTLAGHLIRKDYLESVLASYGDVLSDGSVPFTGSVDINAANAILTLRQTAANQISTINMDDELGNTRLELRYIDVAGVANLALKDAAGTSLCTLSLGVDGNIGLSPPSTPTLAGHIVRKDWLESYAEPVLGDPVSDDYLLSSLADGTRSWVAPPLAQAVTTVEIDIGTWNMDISATKVVSLGAIPWADVISVEASVINDLGTTRSNYMSLNGNETSSHSIQWNAAGVILVRGANGIFDVAGYSSTAASRGTLLVRY